MEYREKDLQSISTCELWKRPIYRAVVRKNPWVDQLISAQRDQSGWTESHEVRTADIGFELGKYLELSEIALESNFQGFLLHDIGKMSILESTLNKQEELTPDERAELDTHPRKGWEVLRVVDTFSAQIAVGHHEYQDRAYPRKEMRCENLHVFLCALADHADAYLSVRPYKNAWSEAKTGEYLAQNPYFKRRPDLIRLAIKVRSTM